MTRMTPITWILCMILALCATSASALVFSSNGGTIGTPGGLLWAGPASIGTGNLLGGGTPFNLSFGPPNATVFRWMGCGPQIINASSTPQYQNSSLGIDYVCNNGTSTYNLGVRLSGPPRSGWVIKASNTSIVSNLLTLGIQYQTIKSLAPGQCTYVWMVAACTNVTGNPGVYEQYDTN